MSTVSPQGSKRLATLHAEHGSILVEAPIFGRPEAALAGKLWICTAGPTEPKTRVRPVLEAMGAQGIYDFGEAIGAATSAKLVGNFLLIAAARSLAESLTVVEQSGFDPGPVVEMLTETLLPAPVYQTYGRMFAAKTLAASQSDIPLKDLSLFSQTAQALGSASPIAGLLIDLLRRRA